MAEKKGGTPGESPRRRAAPTIDLKATEVKAESPAQADAKQEPETEPGPHPTREFIAAAEGRPVDPPRSTFSYVMAGLAGAVLVAVLMFGLWLSGMVPIRYAGATAMRARVSVLEMQLQNLQKSANDGSSAAALEDAKARIARLEQAPAKPREADAQTAERLGKLETAMQGLGLALAGLQKRADEIAGAIALNNERYGETQNRLAALEQAAKTAQEKAERGNDVAARLALAAANVRDAVASNRPYAAELAEVKKLGGDEKTAATLEGYAASGVPSDAALARELTALLPALLQSSGARGENPGGFLERLQANAGKLVRIRPAEEPPGNDPSAVMARIEIKAARGDATGANADLVKLPEKARAPAADWQKKLAARDAALAASRQLAADTARALARP